MGVYHAMYAMLLHLRSSNSCRREVDDGSQQGSQGIATWAEHAVWVCRKGSSAALGTSGWIWMRPDCSLAAADSSTALALPCQAFSCVGSVKRL